MFLKHLSGKSQAINVCHFHQDKSDISPKQKLLRLAILIVLFSTAFLVRCYKIGQPELNFHEAKQCWSYDITRMFYYEHAKSIQSWQKDIAKHKLEKIAFKEPPILEYLISKVYLLVKAEYFWIPKLFSISFWLIGGLFLYQILIRLTAFGPAAAALAFYLFLPFGFFISRSFMPEPFMTMFFIAGILAIYRYFEKPSTKRLLVSALVSAVAILIKFFPLFPITIAFLFLSFFTNRKNKMRLVKESFIFLTIAVLPSLLYYPYMYFNSRFLHSAATTIFLPELIITSFFWKGWIHTLGMTIGLIAATISLAGVFMQKNKKAKTLLAGLWLGYFIYGLLFSYTTATHDYYQVLIVPIATLSMIPVCEIIIDFMGQFSKRQLLALSIIAIFMALPILNIVKNIKHDQFRDMDKGLKKKLWVACDIIGINPHHLKRITRDYTEDINMYKHIGQSVHHSTNVIMLSNAYGYALRYFGQVAGASWPGKVDIEYFKNIVKKQKNFAQIRLNRIIEKTSPEYFIITDFENLRAQPDLKSALDTNFKIFEKTQNFIIYDLK
jgi:dolichyl-phosphate-mannose-protein mannosyltransferase